MPTLTVSDEQVMELVNQLPPERQKALLTALLAKQWDSWADLSLYGATRVRKAAAQRGRDWDKMTEEERDAFIDDVIHEDR